MGKQAEIKTAQERNTQWNWKLIRRAGLGAFLLTVLITSLAYLQHTQQLETQRAKALQNESQLLQSLQDQTELKLIKLHNLLSTLQGVKNAFNSLDSEQLQQNFDEHWQNLQYEWNLDLIRFFDSANQPLGNWSSRPTHELLDNQIDEWARQYNLSQETINVTSCLQLCSQYVITGIEIDERQQAVVVMSVSLLEMLNQFHQSTGKIVGLLTPALDRATSTSVLTYKWGYELYSLTEAGINEPLLQEFIQVISPVAGKPQSAVTTINQEDYELRLSPLSANDDSFLIFLENISLDQQVLTRQLIQFSLITFVVSAGLLLLLQFSLKRLLTRQEQALQLARIKRTTQKPQTIRDEVLAELTQTNLTETPLDFDLTSDNVMSINDRLDQLKKYNEDINLELAHQMVAVSNERDLVRKILDNTQAIIMTLQADGTIVSINRFGLLVTGYKEKEIKGKNFIELYPEEEPLALNSLQTLGSIAQGEQETYRHEARMSCKDGKERVILWLHSRLNSNDDKDAPLLAAGLDITDHKQLEENLSWLADHDSLTSLYNRRRFEEELDDALSWSNAHETHGSLLYIDLDNFKDINDTCGHQVGDIILRKVAATLNSITQQLDNAHHLICARLGGDEFAMILRNTDHQGIEQLCKHILDALLQIRHNQENYKFQLSCSIGVAEFPGTENNANELLSNADYAMYQAKMIGRNQYYFFKQEDSQREQSQHRLIWREKIESALKEGRFILHYQPILNIQDRTISHYETLIRMLDEDNQLITPSMFIHVAERIGLIQEIDCFILETAIKKQADLMQEGHDITLAINLSGKAFDDPNLSINIEKAIKQYRARAENLIFEITETTAVTDIVSAEKTMRKVQDLGCQFALDDFGVGFSSFYYLRELPVEYVKIDGSFVNDLPENSDNQILVKALSEVAVGFNKLTVAEFVDSLQTLHLLSEAKVNFAQGYFIGKPSEQIPVNPPNFYQASINENTAII